MAAELQYKRKNPHPKHRDQLLQDPDGNESQEGDETQSLVEGGEDSCTSLELTDSFAIVATNLPEMETPVVNVTPPHSDNSGILGLLALPAELQLQGNTHVMVPQQAEVPIAHQEVTLQVGTDMESASRHLCLHCGRSFMNNRTLVVHVQTHNAVPQRCIYDDDCEFTTNSPASMSRHVQQHKGKTYDCKLCDMKFFDPKTLVNHETFKHTSDRQVVCPTCQEVFKTKPCLQRHVLARHTDQTKLPRCEHCQKVCKHKHNLSRHRKLYCPVLKALALENDNSSSTVGTARVTGTSDAPVLGKRTAEQAEHSPQQQPPAHSVVFSAPQIPQQPQLSSLLPPLQWNTIWCPQPMFGDISFGGVPTSLHHDYEPYRGASPGLSTSGGTGSGSVHPMDQPLEINFNTSFTPF